MKTEELIEKEEEVKEEAVKEKDEMAEPEEAEINAYMEETNGEGPNDDEFLTYLKMRYEQVKSDYKSLQLQRAEAEARKEANLLNKLTAAFRSNYKARRWAVIQLRIVGEIIQDRFIPRSTIK